MRELRALLWLESKRAGAAVDYILRIFGVSQETSRLYAIYVAVLLGLWLFTAWAYVIEQLVFIGRNLPSDSLLIVTDIVPPIIIFAQWFIFVLILRGSPLTMSAPDLAFLATSPISRPVLVLVYLFKKTALFLLIAGIASTLLTMLLTDIHKPELGGYAGLWGFVWAVAVGWSSVALIWSITLLKQHLPFQSYRVRFWIIPILLAGLIVLLPQPFMLPGQIWLNTVEARFSNTDGLILLIPVIVSTILLLFSGRYIHLSVMADESQTFARIQRMGFLGQVYARDVIARINRQTRLSHLSRRYFDLPDSQSRFQGLWQRALLGLTRLAPMSFLNLMALGARYTIVIAGSIILFGWQAPQVWLIVGVLILRFRPTELIEPFQRTMESVFVRQFMPLEDMPLIVLADSLFPLLIATAGGWLVLVLVTQTLNIAALLLVPLVLIILMLCQALTWFKPAFTGGSRIAYEYSTLASAVFVIGTAYLTADLWVVVMASLGVIWTLVGFIRDSRSG